MVETPTESCECDACAGTRERIARQAALLQELAGIGMKVARNVGKDADAAAEGAEDTPSNSELALTYARVARAIRQTLALETHLAEGRAIHKAPPSPKQRYLDYRQARDDRAARVEDVVRSLEGGDREDLEERIEAGFEHFGDAPVSVWVSAICRDLGVTVDWALFADEDWAAEEAVTYEGSPFKAFGPQSSPHSSPHSSPLGGGGPQGRRGSGQRPDGGGGPRSGGGGSSPPAPD